jgi:phage gpG-like protein
VAAIRVEVTGNGRSRLAELLKAVGKLNAPMPRRVLTQMAGDVLVDKAKECFASRSSPFGDPWAPLQNEDHSPLVRTGKMYKSIRNESVDGAIVLVDSAPYASYQNSGTRHIPARPFLPTAARGMPRSWSMAAGLVVARAVAKAVGQ